MLPTEEIDNALAELPARLDELRALLTPGGVQDGPRPWLPPITVDYETHHALWGRVVGAVSPYLTADFETRISALKVLAMCPVQAAGHAVAPLLTDEEPIIVLLGQDVVARAGIYSAAAAIAPLLEHDWELVSSRAAGNLGVVGDLEAIPILRSTLERSISPLTLRWAAESLGDLGGASERALLEQKAAQSTDPFVREGIRRGLQALGAGDRLDLHPQPEFAAALQGAVRGDEAGIVWMLDHYEDRRLGLLCHLGWQQVPDQHLQRVLPHLRSDSERRRFAAADIVGWRAVKEAVPTLRDLEENDLLSAVCLAAATSLVRLGASSRLAELWLENFSALSRADAHRALALQVPVPLPIIRTLLDDPCCLVPWVGGQLVRQDGSAEALAALIDALDLEWRRLQGVAEARSPRANRTHVMSSSAIARFLRRARPGSPGVPASLQETVEALQKGELVEAHIVAAHGLLLGLRGFPFEQVAVVLERWLSAASPALRLDAWLLWREGAGRGPTNLSDADPTVRAVIRALT
jgi:HEAT repeat protein